jgi:multiple sugar transport system ATP-binding protein
MIAGLEEISKGTIKIGNRVVNDVPPKDRDIAMVFQNYALYPHMTVYNNMAFGLKLRKFKKAEIDKRVREAAKTLELDEYLDRRPKALSGGQRQRVAMGRAIVREPAVFLFDEPLSNLDAKMRVEMRKGILRLHKSLATTMVYVTHDQVEAMTLGDRICVMNGGIIEQVGEPTDVFDNPKSLFVARFIGTPPMNLFEGELIEESGRPVFVGGSLHAPIAEKQHDAVMHMIGKKVCLGLRPKSFYLKDDVNGDDRVELSGTVEVRELLGDEILAHMESGALKYTVSLDPHSKVDLNGQIDLCLDMERAHIFDSESGRNLTVPE